MDDLPRLELVYIHSRAVDVSCNNSYFAPEGTRFSDRLLKSVTSVALLG